MHHYQIATDAVRAAVDRAKEAGWTQSEILQSLFVVSLADHAKCSGAESSRQLVQFELANLRDEVDYDFVRSR